MASWCRCVGYEREAVSQGDRDLLVGSHHLCSVPLLPGRQDEVSQQLLKTPSSSFIHVHKEMRVSNCTNTVC